MIPLRYVVLSSIAFLLLLAREQEHEFELDREYMGHVNAFLLLPPKTPCWDLPERIWMLEVLQPPDRITLRDEVQMEIESCQLEGWRVVDRRGPPPRAPDHPPALAPAVREL